MHSAHARQKVREPCRRCDDDLPDPSRPHVPDVGQPRQAENLLKVRERCPYDLPQTLLHKRRRRLLVRLWNNLAVRSRWHGQVAEGGPAAARPLRESLLVARNRAEGALVDAQPHLPEALLPARMRALQPRLEPHLLLHRRHHLLESVRCGGGGHDARLLKHSAKVDLLPQLEGSAEVVVLVRNLGALHCTGAVLLKLVLP
mmetsp:Transcript_6432/g.13057  ORF Transcript_6432/g.13057 Transcript_6432/m.13057 type:complete len:201 (-) Transcript_6432:257-859(-)